MNQRQSRIAELTKIDPRDLTPRQRHVLNVLRQQEKGFESRAFRKQHHRRKRPA